MAHQHDVPGLAQEPPGRGKGRGEKLVMSFHGVPERTLHLGDPYHCECLKTGRLLAEALGLRQDELISSTASFTPLSRSCPKPAKGPDKGCATSFREHPVTYPHE